MLKPCLLLQYIEFGTNPDAVTRRTMYIYYDKRTNRECLFCPLCIVLRIMLIIQIHNIIIYTYAYITTKVIRTNLGRYMYNRPVRSETHFIMVRTWVPSPYPRKQVKFNTIIINIFGSPLLNYNYVTSEILL